MCVYEEHVLFILIRYISKYLIYLDIIDSRVILIYYIRYSVTNYANNISSLKINFDYFENREFQ